MGGWPPVPEALGPPGASLTEGRGTAPHSPCGGRKTGGPVPNRRLGGAIVVASEVVRPVPADGNRNARPTGPP